MAHAHKPLSPREIAAELRIGARRLEEAARILSESGDDRAVPIIEALRTSARTIKDVARTVWRPERGKEARCA